MADTKVSDLNSITVADNNDVLYIVSSTQSKKITYENLIGNQIATINSNISELSSNQSINLSGQVESNTDNIETLDTQYFYLSSELDAAFSTLSVISDFVDEGINSSITISGTTLTFLSGILISVT